MSRSVPQTNYAAVNGAGYDYCLTPRHAYLILQPYIRKDAVIWECATGDGWLANWIREFGNEVVETDIRSGVDFLAGNVEDRTHYEPDHWDILITNVPFSLKYKFLKRAYELGKPFAFLVPYSTVYANTAKKIRDQFGVVFEELRPNQRINYAMPSSGFHNAGAQMTTEWLCWQVLPRQIIDVDLPEPLPEHRLVKPPKKRKPGYEDILQFVRSHHPKSQEEVARLIQMALSDGVPLYESVTIQPELFAMDEE